MDKKFTITIDKILRWPIIYPLYYRYYRYSRGKRRKGKKSMDLFFKPEDINFEYYNKIKDLGETELEHQVGRLSNYKEIINKCENLTGDFIEFGSWKGFSLLWIAYFLERAGIYSKKLVGLDGFVGLPYNDGVFMKRQFWDTSLQECRRNVKENKILYPETRKNILIEKFFFKDADKIWDFLQGNKIQKFSFIHIDCDVSQSVEEIFSLLLKHDLIAPKAYILFDDYGMASNLANTVDRIFDHLSAQWQISEHSKTCYTKNFYFEKKIRKNFVNF